VSIGGGHRLRGDAAEAYNQMALAASRDGVTWSITDSYRDYATQVRLAEEKGLYSQGGLAATPGTSNHGFGLAVDLGGGANNSGTAQNNWLVANASRFGFFTIPREPWHWEYRGVGI
jgi:LAS superfamily LD-carboxypeptidase LdcB